MYYLDCTNTINDNELKKIALHIKNGKIAIFPTETVYAIGTNGLNSDAVKKIYDIKRRNLKNPINLLVNSINMVESITKNITKLEYKLMDAFFPGPFTLILEKNDMVPSIITSNSNTIGVRMPNNDISLKLIKYANVPIAAPSANISGKPSITQLDDILDDFAKKADYIINGGATNLGIESTIVKVIDDIPYILRPGIITPDQIKKIATKVAINNSLLPSNNLKHYQLTIPSILVYSKNTNNMIEKINTIAKKYKKSIIMSFSENCKFYNNYYVIDMGSKNNLDDVSKKLFSNLKKAEKLNYDIIIIEGIEKTKLGLAIMNRLLNICNNYIEI